MGIITTTSVVVNASKTTQPHFIFLLLTFGL